jgi:hypothetical protein
VRICDNCYGRKDGVLTVGAMGVNTIMTATLDLCMPCLDALKGLRWMQLDERMDMRVSPGIGHRV